MIERDNEGGREEREKAVDEAAAEGMRKASSTDEAAEWRAIFDYRLRPFLNYWEHEHGLEEPFSLHDMYDAGLPDAPGGGDCAGPAVLAASRAGIIRRVGEKKSTRESQHRAVSAYLRGDAA